MARFDGIEIGSIVSSRVDTSEQDVFEVASTVGVIGGARHHASGWDVRRLRIVDRMPLNFSAIVIARSVDRPLALLRIGTPSGVHVLGVTTATNASQMYTHPNWCGLGVNDAAVRRFPTWAIEVPANAGDADLVASIGIITIGRAANRGAATTVSHIRNPSLPNGRVAVLHSHRRNHRLHRSAITRLENSFPESRMEIMPSTRIPIVNTFPQAPSLPKAILPMQSLRTIFSLTVAVKLGSGAMGLFSRVKLSVKNYWWCYLVPVVADDEDKTTVVASMRLLAAGLGAASGNRGAGRINRGPRRPAPRRTSAVPAAPSFDPVLRQSSI